MNSFSQGIFVFKNGLHGKPDKRKKSSKFPIPQTKRDINDSDRLWNDEFERTWGFVQSKVDVIQANNNDGHLAELCDFVKKSGVSTKDGIENDSCDITLLRVAALLTGINKPDHHLYFTLLANTMRKKKIARAVFLPARDCPNVRTAMETLVSCILSNGRKHNYRDEDAIANNNTSKIGSDDSGESDHNMSESDDDEPPVKLRRSQYTLHVLQSWYDTKFANEPNESKPQLAVIMPNFEEFKASVIKDLIQILSNHCERLPFVLILGVATSTTALLNTLSFTETTRIKLRVFSGQPPNQILDQIFDNIILTPKCPFQLSSNVLDYLKNVFIFFDLTAKNFLRSVNYCLLDQYSHGNAYSVCSTTFRQAKKNITKMDHDDFELIRRCPSFRPYIEALLAKEDRESAKHVIAMLNDDALFRKQLIVFVRDIYIYFSKFYGYIRLLWTLVKDLPNAPMGKRLSDIYMYCHASEKNVTTTEEFEKCWQLLGLMTKEQFIILLEKCHQCLEVYEDTHCDEDDEEIDGEVLSGTHSAFDTTFQGITDLIAELRKDRAPDEPEAKQSTTTPAFQSRTQYYQNLKQQNRARTESGVIARKALDFFRFDVFEKHLTSRDKAPPLLELFVYSDSDQLRTHLRGTSRSAIHKALTDPHSYLRCDCCAIEDRFQLLPSMPDNSIAYKLLLESGQQVNIYDWMSAFNAIVGDHADADDDEDDNAGEISPEIQARFTRARAELHFMGFTKNSKRKTDHVTRTTW